MTTTTASTHEPAPDGHGRSAPRYDDVNIPVIVLVAMISALVTFLTIALVQGMCYDWQSAYLKKRELQFETVNAPAKMDIQQQKDLLQGAEEGTLPIGVAIKKVIAEYSNPEPASESSTSPTTEPKTEPETEHDPDHSDE